MAAAAGGPIAGCAPTPAVVRPVSIVVATGPFADVSAAGAGEACVDWWDADPSDDDACTEGFAALELRRHLSRALALPESAIALQRAPTLPPTGDVFVLGSRRSNPLIATLAGHARPQPGAGPDGFRLRALRRGGRSVFLIEGDGRTGTLYGVYAFLETLGVRFYGLGDTGITWPPTPPALPRRLDLVSRPAFLTRGFWAWEPRGDPEFFLWMARNRMNLWTAAETDAGLLKKLGIRLTGGGHVVQAEFLDPRAPHDGRRSNFEAHPEWYGLHDGRRSDRIHGEAGDNFCTSNAGAVHEFAGRMIEALATGSLRHADVVNLWPLDQGRWCECERCQALGNPADRMLDLVARVDAELRAARRSGRLTRDVELTSPAYLETLVPPTRPLPAGYDTARCTVTFFPYFRCYAHALADESCTEINARLAARFAGWALEPGRTYRGPLAIGEYYNVNVFKSLPLVFPHVMAADLRWYYRHGARHFHYMHAPTRAWGTWTLQHAVLARLLWDPAADVDELLDEFCRCYYPTSAAHMAAFAAALETASANILAIEQCIGAFGTGGAPAGRLTAAAMPLFPLAHLGYDRRSAPANSAPSWVETMDAMRRARHELDAALAVCRGPLERSRLLDDERRFAYGEATFALYDRVLRAAGCDRAGDGAGLARELAAADSLAGRLRTVHDLVQVASSHANARDGLDASHVERTLAYFRARVAGAAIRRARPGEGLPPPTR